MQATGQKTGKGASSAQLQDHRLPEMSTNPGRHSQVSSPELDPLKEVCAAPQLLFPDLTVLESAIVDGTDLSELELAT